METSFDFAVSAVKTWDKDVAIERQEADGESCLERCSRGGKHEWDSLSQMWVVEDLAPMGMVRSAGRRNPRRRAFALRRCRKCHLEIESYEDWQ
jgi:hemolysin-activating ACP:hemolysin acyltransferase